VALYLLQWLYVHCSGAILTAAVVHSLQWYCICCNGTEFAAVILHSLQWCYIHCTGAVLAAENLSEYPVFPQGQIGQGVDLNTHP
jgi:hypothetical protein